MGSNERAAAAATPTIEGFSLRPYRGVDDIPAIAGIYRAADDANGLTSVWTDRAVRVELDNWSHLDPHEDLILGCVDGRPVATSEIGWSDTAAGDRHYLSLGHVHPRYRRHGIGRVMLDRNERRLGELAARHEVAGRKVLMSWTEELDRGARALFEARGYERVREYHHMTRPDLEGIPMNELPDGLVVRPVTEAELPVLWDGMMEAFRDHFGAQDASPAAFRRWTERPAFARDLLIVAFAGGEVAGAVAAFIDAVENETRGYRRGWTDPVFTRRNWRRQGLASALLGRALLALRDRGMTSAQLEVDGANPNDAKGLYARLGFVADRISSEWHRSLSV